MKVPRLGVKLELQWPAHTTATAMPDPSHIFDLHHHSWQCGILKPLSGARNRTFILMDTSQVCYCWTTRGTPGINILMGVLVSCCICNELSFTSLKQCKFVILWSWRLGVQNQFLWAKLKVWPVSVEALGEKLFCVWSFWSPPAFLDGQSLPPSSKQTSLSSHSLVSLSASLV